jgi:hypothetical protein
MNVMFFSNFLPNDDPGIMVQRSFEVPEKSQILRSTLLNAFHLSTKEGSDIADSNWILSLTYERLIPEKISPSSSLNFLFELYRTISFFSLWVH